MFLTERRLPAALGVKAWLSRAGLMRAPPVVYVHHSILSMPSAVRWYRGALKITFRK